MARVVISFLFSVILIAGAAVLQIFLSKKESKWPGLVLPLITFFFSLIAISGIVAFESHTAVTQLIYENGEIVSKITESAPKEPIMNTSSLLGKIIMVFLLFNIPTVILLAMYSACRGKRKRNIALEKMSVHDLE